MCLDWSNVELQGDLDQDIYKNVDVALLPCNMKETIMAPDSINDDNIPENCN